MSEVSDWATTPTGNAAAFDDIDLRDGRPRAQGKFNMRAIMAAVRRWSSATRLDRAVDLPSANNFVAGRIVVPTYSACRVRAVFGGIVQGFGSYGSEAIWNVSRELGAITIGVVGITEWGEATAAPFVTFDMISVGGNTAVEAFLNYTGSGGFSGWATVIVEGGGTSRLSAA